MSTMPRPVLPEPVMPTITPWVVKSPDGDRRQCAGALVRGRVDQPAEEEVSHGRHATSRRLSSGRGCRLDPVGAAAIAGQHVLRSPDVHVGAERRVGRRQARRWHSAPHAAAASRIGQ